MINRASVLAWNLGHKVYKSRTIPDRLGVALERLNTDVVFLSEYVDHGDADRTRFLARLDKAGYIHRALAPAPASYKTHYLYNRIFLASRLPFTIGDSNPPSTDEFATSNFLHIHLCDSEIELIGLRAPAYEGTDKKKYRQELTELLRSGYARRALAVVGDWNRYPFRMISDMYSVPEPQGAWSYLHSRGDSKLDFVIHTPRISLPSAPTYRYPVGDDGVALAGLKASGAITDHAPLAFTAVLAD